LSWFVPTANGQEPWLNATPTSESGTSATGEPQQSPIRFGIASVESGIAPLENDATSRAAQASSPVGNMTYHGGPVQHAQKVFTIFWNPTVSPFPAGYQTTINQFVQDLNGTPYYAIASQYGDGVGNISTALTYGGTWLDLTNIIPNNPPTITDLETEVSRAMAANGWTGDANSYFQIYTPSGYGTAAAYCGYHVNGSPAFGLILFPADHTGPGGGTCFPAGPYPNTQVVDAAINTSAHEIMETLTDPLLNAWYYVSGSGEIGDLCNFMFGSRAPDGSDVVLNGHRYLVQQEWSNAISGCALSYTAGPPPATTVLSPTGRVSTNLPAFAWNTVSSATSYYLSVQTLSGTPVIQQAYTSAVCGTSTCSVMPAVPLSRGSYMWSVETRNGAGGGPVSSSLSFFVGSSTPGDFDGDAKADLTVFRPSSANWYVLSSGTSYSTSSIVQWGLVDDKPEPGDYDGDGKTDPAVFRPSIGTWFILKSSTNYTTSMSLPWGVGTDIPVPADYDGDGKIDPAVYRPSTGQWFILTSGSNYTASLVLNWGVGTDTPLPGDYDGDGKADPAVYRPSTGQWFILESSTSYTTFRVVSWGLETDVPVPGDYDGDGKADPAVYRPSTGQWFILESSSSYTTFRLVSWGVDTDVPVPGDYDGDGESDPAVFRPSTGQWFILKSSTNYTTNIVKAWGVGTDMPINKRP
jgi:hypothetical protein